MMIQVGNVGVGKVFLYDGALFVVMPFDWDSEKYFNLCIASDNDESYEVGEYYDFKEVTEVEEVSSKALKNAFISK